MKTKRQLIEARHKNKIWQREKDGKWLTHYYDRTGKRRSIECKNRSDLLDKLINIYEEKDNSVTLRDVYDSWIEECRDLNTVSPVTLDRYDCDFRRFFDDTEFVNRIVSSLTHRDVYMFVRSVIYRDGMTAKAFANFRTLLRNIFLRAKIDGYTDISIRDVLDE